MPESNAWFSQGIAVVLIPFLIQWAKQSRMVTWVTDDTARVFAWMIGIVVALGIHLTGHFDPQTGHVTGTIAFNVFDVGRAVGGQLGGQELVYNNIQTRELFKNVIKALAAQGLPTPPSSKEG